MKSSLRLNVKTHDGRQIMRIWQQIIRFQRKYLAYLDSLQVNSIRMKRQMNRCFLIFLLIAVLQTITFSQKILQCDNGMVHFKSDAPLEVIEAESQTLKGALDVESRNFAFTIDIHSFEGFNNPLQKVHFNENYLETKVYPKGTFRGKIIEEVDLLLDGDYSIRAKGMLDIHGVERERIIRCDIQVKNGKILVTSEFTILLEEHAIRIPKIVYQKISEVIYVKMKADFNLGGA